MSEGLIPPLATLEGGTSFGSGRRAGPPEDLPSGREGFGLLCPAAPSNPAALRAAEVLNG